MPGYWENKVNSSLKVVSNRFPETACTAKKVRQVMVVGVFLESSSAYVTPRENISALLVNLDVVATIFFLRFIGVWACRGGSTMLVWCAFGGSPARACRLIVRRFGAHDVSYSSTLVLVHRQQKILWPNGGGPRPLHRRSWVRNAPVSLRVSVEFFVLRQFAFFTLILFSASGAFFFFQYTTISICPITVRVATCNFFCCYVTAALQHCACARSIRASTIKSPTKDPNSV
jgi:hypothetical protein